MTSSSVTKDHGASDERDLHAAIMNLPCKNDFWSDAAAQAYREGHKDARHAAAELAAAAEARSTELYWALKWVVYATNSHVDGRDLLAELHPRHTLDIKRRRDGVETWFEGDWLSNLWGAVKKARALIAKYEGN